MVVLLISEVLQGHPSSLHHILDVRRVANLRLEAPSQQGDPYLTPLKAPIHARWPQEGDDRSICRHPHSRKPPNQGETPPEAPSDPNTSPVLA